ncbi:DNA helicase [Tanacetum coccineum]
MEQSKEETVPKGKEMLKQKVKEIVSFNASKTKAKSTPQDVLCMLQNRLLMEETNYNPDILLKERDSLIPRLNEDQKLIFDEITQAVNTNVQKLIFVYGHGGTGKTFLWKAIASALRFDEKIVLVVASSGIASLLLPSGRTAHSRFQIPVNLHDEYIGNGCIGDVDVTESTDTFRIELPTNLCIQDSDTAITELINFIYTPDTFETPSAADLQKKAIVCPKNESADVINAHVLTLLNAEQCVYLSSDEATPHGNDGGETKLLYPVEYLNTLTFAGLPPHRLELKVGAPITLLRNLNIPGGLYNGTMVIADYIGCIYRISNPIISGDATRMRRTRCIIDIQNLDGIILPFLIWGEMAEGFDMEEYAKLQKPVIIVVSSAWATKKYGGLQLSATLATHYYINPNIPEANYILGVYADLINPIPTLEIQKAPYTSQEEEQMRNRHTIESLLSVNPDHYITYILSPFIRIFKYGLQLKQQSLKSLPQMDGTTRSVTCAISKYQKTLTFHNVTTMGHSLYQTMGKHFTNDKLNFIEEPVMIMDREV